MLLGRCPECGLPLIPKTARAHALSHWFGRDLNDPRLSEEARRRYKLLLDFEAARYEHKSATPPSSPATPWYRRPIDRSSRSYLLEMLFFLAMMLSTSLWETCLIMLAMWLLAVNIILRSEETIRWSWIAKIPLCILAACLVCLLGAKSVREQWNSAHPMNLTNALVRVPYSSSQTISMVPADEDKRTLNLDNIATLWIASPFNSNSVTLMWIAQPSVTVEQPIQHPPIQTFQATTNIGPQRRIPFDLQHPVQLLRVGNRIFRVRLTDIRDRNIRTNTQNTTFWFEYEFAISEEELTADNLAAAISQPQ